LVDESRRAGLRLQELVEAMNAVTLGYIRNPRADFAWFIALPFLAIGVALGFHNWLPYMAVASIAVWVTVPHHSATWVRSYGMQEDWSRWRERLTLGPILIVLSIFLGFAVVPISVALVLLLWDHQHSMMQQHGFARIYDFKAGSGSPVIGRLDFWLGVVLYGNLLVVAPIWSELWIAELYRWKLQLSAPSILTIQTASLTVTGLYLAFYVGSVAWSLTRGYRVNPMKYLFIGASYTLWYYVSWQDSLLIYGVAHRIMHGVQYIVMVYWFIGTKAERTGQTPRFMPRFGLAYFLLLGVAYTVVFHLATGAGLGIFGFGLVRDLQVDEYLQFSPEKATGFVAATAVTAASAVHYWVDSFIWKVSDAKTQEGL
jgi:hypothetical protein